MRFLAASGLEKVQKIPTDFWWKAAIGIAAFIAVVVILRKVAKMNKVILGVIVFVTLVIVGFTWIYERNEPAFMTPVVDKIAPFLPSKGSYGNKQQHAPKT